MFFKILLLKTLILFLVLLYIRVLKKFKKIKYKNKVSFIFKTDTPTAKARWVLIYIHFQIYSKAYETNEIL